MNMALKVDVLEAQKMDGMNKPIDLVHLSNLTMGDRELQLDVLKMFLAQIPNYLDMIKQSDTQEEIYRTAHTIKGAASSVGAFNLANLAKKAEASNLFPMVEILAELNEITDYVSDIASED